MRRKGRAAAAVAAAVAAAAIVAALSAAMAAPAREPAPARAEPPGREPGSGLERAVHELDGQEFMTDEPIWLCTDPSYAPAAGLPGRLPHRYALRRGDVRDRGVLLKPVEAETAFAADPAAGAGMPRGGEFTETFGVHDPSGRAPLLGFANGIPAGEWQVHHATGDTDRVLARFRVVEPRGSERSVRDGLARAARLVLAGDSDPEAAQQAARLYEAILQHYPRTAYLSVVYAGLWRVRGRTRFADDPDRWLEEVFARFHDSCFGTVALDQWVRDMGAARARPTVARLVGIYPGTALARAAQRYLAAPPPPFR